MKKSFLTFLLMLFCLAGFAQQTVTGVILEEATSGPRSDPAGNPDKGRHEGFNDQDA